MKRFLATGLAAAVGMAAVAAFPTGASAHGWRSYPSYSGYYYAPPPPPPTYYYYPQPYYYQYDPGPAIVAGVLGTFLGAVLHSQRHYKVYKKKY
ncbi:hypothetical protein BH10PSE9_BH10PSE9_10060 [soil metagenome]